jgi:hypothetical protein
MLDTNVKLIFELKSFITTIYSEVELLDHFRYSKSDFVRNRKLNFVDLILLITKLCKKTLSIELLNFFNDLGKNCNYTVSAYVQHRAKLKPLFFRVWNKILCDNWYSLNALSVKKWKNYRVIAADGSNITLVNTTALNNYFGGQHNQTQSYTLAKTFYHYDVLNELIIQSNIQPYKKGELPMAYDLIDSIEEDMLMIYDRNFSNYKMLAMHLWQERERKFVIRAKDSLAIIKKFKESGKSTDEVNWLPTESAKKGLQKSGYLINNTTTLKVRLVRVELETCTEVLITNLWEDEGYCSSIFKDLYFMRWGIETNIALQKNIMQLESFSGLNVNAVEQDFYATIFMSNLQSALIKQPQKNIDEKVNTRKYPIKINKNKSFGMLKSNLVELFIQNKSETILKKLYDFFLKEILPIRKNRKFERVKKNIHSHSKYKTYTNFKPAY